MKLIKIEYLNVKGDFQDKEEFKTVMKVLKDRIIALTFNSPDKFVINPTKKGNGVKPISRKFCRELPEGWKGETTYPLMDGVDPGPIDVFIDTGDGRIAVEWETGNISSSHRALNKLAIGIITKRIEAGILILPSKALYPFLTDRVGNYDEFAPYFILYRNLQFDKGLLAVIVVEHDETSEEVPLIPKGKDGNAIRRMAKKKVTKRGVKKKKVKKRY